MGEPSPKQIAFLKKNGQPVPATSREASAAIAKIYDEKGIPQKEQSYSRPTSYPKRDFSDKPPTDKMIAALKKADWYTPGMSGKEGSQRLDILANNNWRKPENVAAPDTTAADLVY
jgi:hypothetical protein